MADISALQQEIVNDISGKLRLKLSGEEKQRLARRPTENAEAYKFYLQGRQEMNKSADQGWKKAAEYFQQAVDQDPNYAAAYAGLSDAYGALGYNVDLPPKAAYEKSRVAAERSIALDDTLAEGHEATARTTGRTGTLRGQSANTDVPSNSTPTSSRPGLYSRIRPRSFASVSGTRPKSKELDRFLWRSALAGELVLL